MSSLSAEQKELAAQLRQRWESIYPPSDDVVKFIRGVIDCEYWCEQLLAGERVIILFPKE